MINKTAAPWTLVLLLLFSLGAHLPLNAQANAPQTMNKTAYPEAWTTIDSLIGDGLFQSALEAVNALQQKAAREKQQADAIKAIVFQNSLQANLSETPYQEMVQNIERYLEQATSIEKGLLQFMLAEAYQAYLSDNYWKLQDRTALVESTIDPDWRKQTPAQLQQEIMDLYSSALETAALKTTPADNYALLWQNEKASTTLRPSLYDVLAHQVIDYLKDARSYLTTPRETFQLPDSVYFAEIDIFLQQNFTADQHSPLKAKALQVFQDLLRFRKKQDNFPALIDLDLHRLQFARQRSNIPTADTLYLKALNRLIEQHQYQQGMGKVHLEKAEQFYTRGQNYSPAQGQRSERWKLQEAIKLCRQLITALPHTDAAEDARQLIATIEAPFLELSSEKVVVPQQPGLAKISYKNLKKAYLKVVELDFDTRLELSRQNNDAAAKIVAARPALAEWQSALPNAEDHHQHSIETKIPGLPSGQYALVFADLPGFDTSQANTLLEYYPFSVSQIAYLWRNDTQGKTVFVMTDRENGQPLKDVQAMLYEVNYDYQTQRTTYEALQELRSDEKGFIQTNIANRSFIAKFIYEQDSLFFNESFYNGRAYEQDETYDRTAFFLDRAIYRPGQTIYFKGIATRHDSKKPASVDLLAGEKINLVFRDANYQEIITRTFTTNEYGTFNGSFAIPQSMLTGSLTIYSDHGGSVRFHVEEYKRPKFQVSLDPLAGDYTLGDEVTIEGIAEAFAGSVVDGAEVVYRVSRQDLRPFPWYRSSYDFHSFPDYGQEVEIAHGRTSTDSTGRFQINFTALANPDIPTEQRPRFQYKVQVDVVDITGETQSTNRSFTLAYTGLVAHLEMPDEIDKSVEPAPWQIITENHNGSPMMVEGSIRVYELKSPEQVFKNRYWELPTEDYPDAEAFRRDFPNYAPKGEDQWQNWPRTLMQKYGFSTAEAKTFTFPADQYEIGHYLVELKTEDQDGNAITFRKPLQIVNTETRSIPENVLLWKRTPAKSFEPGETLRMPLAVNAPLHILLEIERQGKIIRQKWLRVNDWTRIQKTIEAADRGNLQVQLSFIYQNRAHTEMVNITVPYSNKELHFEYSTFRDKLRPGQEEEWIIKISGEKKEEVAAEMVATMYDASLDQFTPHQWQLNYYNSSYQLRYPWRPRLFGTIDAQAGNRNNYYNSGTPAYPYLRLYLEPNALRYTQGPVSYMLRSRSAETAVSYDAATAKTAAMSPPPPPPQAELDEIAVAANGPAEEDSSATEEQLAPVQVRTNLDETVFFQPELRTDEAGNVYLKFTMNEALTTWKFLGFAHTKDLKIGITQREIITQKELMVLPNPPRFVREGDQFEFTSKVSNLTDQALSGEATIQFFDPFTQKEVTDLVLQKTSTQPFLAKAGQSDRLGWTINIPFGKLNALSYRIIARTENFSDGEENSLPVVTNRVLVTETMPIALRSKEKKKLTFTAMQQSMASKTAQGHLFQLDFTSNPVWLAIKSLPYLMEYPYDCSEQIFNRFYANRIARSILDSNPKISSVFASWKDTDALESELEKRAALKTTLLEETPWVLAAQSEAEQRERIALLFDLERLSKAQANTLRQLTQRQNNNGSFSWFEGGNGNWYITNYIIAGFGHLDALGMAEVSADQSIRALVSKALNYADTELLRHYERLQELAAEDKLELNDNHLSPTIIHYLYAKSFFTDIDTQASEQAALDYFLGQAQKYWLQTTLLQQGQIGLIARRMKMPTLSQKILASLKERAMQSEDLGMYWKYQNGYFWYQSPIETHTIMIEFFAEMGEKALLDELKIWLLKNKQTNAWPTTKTTAEAIWALLSTADSRGLLMEEDLIELKFPDWRKAKYADKLEAAQQAAETGTGQFEVAWQGNAITRELASIKVKNPNNQIAWGAAYWQYFEDLDKVQTFEDTPLKLEKQLFLTKDTPEGSKLSAIRANTELHPGDLITVRIKLAVDRDMDFIHMKDMRASGLEPINVISRYKWQGGLGYYESTKDLATHFFFDNLPKGDYVFEYPLRVQLNGDFSNGICTIQSMYAPEFSSHSEGTRLKVIEK